ncbi:MAG TPA: hypothetical protein VMF89_09445, partial [Polyangiales bacterium]|nr:hypothetical protein [Polyangiales bacterium]
RMFSSRALRVLTVVVIPLGSLLGGHFVHARGKPDAEAQTAPSDSESDTRSDSGASSSGSSREGRSGSRDRDTRDARDAKDRERESDDSKSERAAKDSDAENDKTIRVLLVGNSYTMHHSLHSMLQKLAAQVEGGPRMTVDAVAHGGYSLSNHLRTGQALTRIRAGHYTHVVLQGHSMSAVDHPDKLIADAKRFKQAIDASSGQTVFYATWARSPEVRLYRTHKSVRSFAQMSMLVSSTYFELSSLLRAGLAPVGSAFERALVEHPKLGLWGSDGSHPSVAGSYMAACVLYGAITGLDPSTTRYVPNSMKPEDAELVRGVAARSLAAARNALATPNTEVTTAGPFLGPT